MNRARLFALVLLLSLVVDCRAQLTRAMYHNEDSLKNILAGSPNDTTRIILLLQLAQTYFFKQPDTSLMYAAQAVELSRSLKASDYHMIVSVLRVGESMRQAGKFSEAMKMHLKGLELSQKAGNSYLEAESYGFMGLTYLEMHSYDNAVLYLKKAIAGHEQSGSDGGERLFMVYIARAYIETNKLDSSFYFLAKAKEIPPRSQARFPMNLSNTLGYAFLLDNNLDSADFYYRLGLRSAPKELNFRPHYVSQALVGLATVFIEKNLIDSALYFARYAYSVVGKKNLPRSILETSSLLAQLHRKTGELDSVVYYLDKTSALNDSIYGNATFNRLHLLLLDEQKRVQEVQRSEERSKSNQQLIGLVSVTAVIFIASILLFRNNRIKQKTNFALQQTLKELQATQSQLIQSEKMASLGELTAGIAHEIQNPLNFVNNFSEVNDELIDDLKKEVVAGNNDLVLEIANSIKSNQEKINHHGKRAGGIVKSMLQHSRSSTGQKELTDINELCDEYVRLTYHGYRAKEKSFDVKLNSDFDPSLPKVKVVRQDIGRVLLNLMNNAFYAVNDKAKSNIPEYEPTVTIATKVENDKVEISVRDNGKGIPEEIREKIFQPFFTTKPTGQGTGLGLSLSYDIIKAHGGTIVVNSPPSTSRSPLRQSKAGQAGNEGEGAEFIIQLPI